MNSHDESVYALIQALYRCKESSIIESNWRFVTEVQTLLLKYFTVNTHKFPTKDQNVFALIPDSIEDERKIFNEFRKDRPESDTTEEELIF